MLGLRVETRENHIDFPLTTVNVKKYEIAAMIYVGWTIRLAK
jgi:hypothetical protein